MDIQSTINTDEMYRRFSAVEYSKLNDTFRNAIEKSLEILKQATLSNLRSTGIDVTSPVKKGGQSYNPLIKGVSGWYKRKSQGNPGWNKERLWNVF